jgi:hypothetical protein
VFGATLEIVKVCNARSRWLGMASHCRKPEKPATSG